VTVIVVSGAPGTGKSTVAAALAHGLRWPLLSLDPVKEALADVLGLGPDTAGPDAVDAETAGPAAEDWSNRLGDAAAEIVFRLSGRFPDAVAEGWWRGDRRERALAEFAGATEVFCYCEPGLALARMRARHGTGQHGQDRHPIHRDVMNPAVLDRASMLAATVTPLGLGAALIRVDTGRTGGPATALAAVTEELGLAGPGGAAVDRCQ
jgi:hypothetical protein